MHSAQTSRRVGVPLLQRLAGDGLAHAVFAEQREQARGIRVVEPLGQVVQRDHRVLLRRFSAPTQGFAVLVHADVGAELPDQAPIACVDEGLQVGACG